MKDRLILRQRIESLMQSNQGFTGILANMDDSRVQIEWIEYSSLYVYKFNYIHNSMSKNHEQHFFAITSFFLKKNI